MATVPLIELANELNNDPAGLGYKDGENFKSVDEILNLLGARRTQANPVPQPDIPKPLVLKDFMTDMGGLDAFDWSAFKDFKDAIDASDRDTLQVWLDAAFAKTWIDGTKRTQMMTDWINATIPDPSWQATVSLQSRFMELWGSAGYDNLDKLMIQQVIG
jgi:hypothetical protein